MCPWVGSHAPSCARQLWGAAEPCGVSLTTGGVAPASVRYDRLTLVARVAGPRCLASDPLLGCVPARLSPVVAMAPGDVCHAPRCSPTGVGPVALEYRSCSWPGGSAGSSQCVRPCGVWFVVPCPSVALRAYARAMSGASWRLFTGARVMCLLCAVSVATWLLFIAVRAVCGTRVTLVASLGSPLLLFVFFVVSCSILSSFFFFFFLAKEKRKRGARTPQAKAWAIGAAVWQCCVPRRGACCWCLPGGCAPRVRLACHDVYGCRLVWVRLGVSLRLGYASGGASGRDSRVRWCWQVRRM